MLLLQKDYIIIELDTDAGNWACGDDNGPIWGIDFTIQCNGKLKKHRTCIEARDTDKVSQCRSSYRREFNSYLAIYESIDMIIDLGYDIDKQEVMEKLSKIQREEPEFN